MMTVYFQITNADETEIANRVHIVDSTHSFNTQDHTSVTTRTKQDGQTTDVHLHVNVGEMDVPEPPKPKCDAEIKERDTAEEEHEELLMEYEHLRQKLQQLKDDYAVIMHEKTKVDTMHYERKIEIKKKVKVN